MSPLDRRNAILQGVPRLVDDARELDPEAILFVKKTIFEPVKAGLEKGGLGRRILNREPLPFPSHGNQANYRKALKQYLIKNHPANSRKIPENLA